MQRQKRQEIQQYQCLSAKKRREEWKGKRMEDNREVLKKMITELDL